MKKSEDERRNREAKIQEKKRQKKEKAEGRNKKNIDTEKRKN